LIHENVEDALTMLLVGINNPAETLYRIVGARTDDRSVGASGLLEPDRRGFSGDAGGPLSVLV
jgi:hypothetical protein